MALLDFISPKTKPNAERQKPKQKPEMKEHKANPGAFRSRVVKQLLGLRLAP